MPRRDRIFFLSITVLVLLLNWVPFFLATRAGGNDYLFNGVLLNPLDGQTYLAKMYEGFRGDWRFTLPYTPNPGQGAYINMLYLFLGHVARLTHLSLPTVFTLGRLLGGVVLLFALYRFFLWTIPDARPRRLAFALAALGSGMGWLLIPVGAFTADLWVAETYPFLSIYNNPHFPLGLALILFLLTFPTLRQSSPTWKGALAAIVALLLGIISPFGVVIAVVVMGGWVLSLGYESFLRREWKKILTLPQFTHLAWIILGGAPMLIYQLWAIRTDPILAGWDAQNLTLTPPWWDVLFSLSPALLLAIAGGIKTKPGQPAFPLTVWAVVGLVLILIPFGLQRRFLMGLYVPLAGLAALGIESLARGKRTPVRWLTIALFLLALPTNLIVLLAGQTGAQSRDLALFHTRDESLAFTWLSTQTPPDALILAAPDTGLLIPAYTGRQVIYGHPFETVNAKVEEQTVLNFFQTMPAPDARALLMNRDVDYVFFGPRERTLGELPLTSGLIPAYEVGTVQIYAVEK
ncbi:MAG TPA: hypothetical protein PK530_05085 [Anaerolineales bacterium]|nr:hypothetical protein [Anaerolineales bacterium]